MEWDHHRYNVIVSITTVFLYMFTHNENLDADNMYILQSLAPRYELLDFCSSARNQVFIGTDYAAPVYEVNKSQFQFLNSYW